MEDERRKLLVFLEYLIEHNGEHGKELIVLAEEAKTIANGVVINHIRKAARTMDEATGYLKQALEEVNKN